MKQILNTLFVMTQGAYVSLDHETLKVEVDGKSVLQVPLHHLGGVVARSCCAALVITRMMPRRSLALQ